VKFCSECGSALSHMTTIKETPEPPDKEVGGVRSEHRKPYVIGWSWDSPRPSDGHVCKNEYCYLRGCNKDNTPNDYEVAVRWSLRNRPPIYGLGEPVAYSGRMDVPLIDDLDL
jgi:hypothetical protein